MAGQHLSNLRPQAVSVSAMARMVNLSRASFYAYVKKGVFIAPVYSVANRRPYFTADMIQQNIEARQTGIGVNGQYVLFYEKHPVAAPGQQQRPARRDRHASLMDGLRALGLTSVTAAQVDEALATCFPNGTGDVDDDTVLRAVYRHLRRSGVG